MKSILFALLVISFPASFAVTASPGSTLSIYIKDNDLNISHDGIDVIETSALLEFTINGTPINGPKTMKETLNDSGVFLARVSIPSTINGKPLKTGDVLLVKYHDQSDSSGEKNTITKSFVISANLANISTSAKNVRIGEKFQIKLYEPDWNLDSDKSDTIPLNLVEFRTKGIRTTLANPAFDTSTPGLRETGSNTNFFVVELEMPQKVSGKDVKIGSTVELRFIDTTSASSTPETLKTTVKIGYSK